MSTSLTTEQQIRIAALNAAVGLTARAEYKDGTKTIQVARILEEYIRGEGALVPSGIRIFSTPGEVWTENNSLPDLTGCEISVGGEIDKHTHLPQQHRDRKVPWCFFCGLDRFGQKPIIVGEKD